MKKTSSKGFDFEKSLQELEEINAALQKGDLTLEKSLQIYEKGVSLAAKCYKVLNDAKLKVIEIDKALINIDDSEE